MVFCSKCGNEETSDKSFCSKCGEKLQVFDDKAESFDDKEKLSDDKDETSDDENQRGTGRNVKGEDKSHKEPFKIYPAGWVLIFFVVLILLVLAWAFTGNDRETVYDESHCRYLYSLGLTYEERGVYGKDNVAMSDYKRNC